MLLKNRIHIRPIHLCIFLFWAFSLWVYDKNVRESLHPRHDFREQNRLVNVMIIADQAFVGNDTHSQAMRRAASILTRASNYFEKSVGIRFSVCRFSARDHFDFDALSKTAKAGCDIIVGFTGKKLESDTGESEKGEGIILFSTYHEFRLSRFLAHELGHIFGAWHRDMRGMLMHEDGTFMGDSIDNWNWHVIMFNKYRDFPR